MKCLSQMKKRVIFFISLVILVLLLSGGREIAKYLDNLKTELRVITQYAATLEALNHFKAGQLRIYELREGGNREFANRNDGPFQVWYYPYYPIIGAPYRYRTEIFIDAYNTKMKHLYTERNELKSSVPREKKRTQN